jgi:diguanylate cyclase (GGDEF)-like protein
VLVAGLITARQFVAFRENARLLHEKRISEERLQHEVTHDGLTGLANRALFRDRLAAALAGGDEGDVTVLLIDLDDFKAVNDSLGHGVGDRLLVSLARVLREQTAGDGLPVRLGGDEFAVLMVGGTVVGETVAQRLHDALSRPLGEDRLLVQASIGIATAGAGTTRDALLRHADVAMYAAKQRGKANHVRFVPGMEEPVLAHMQLGGELRRALDRGEFRVFYQPVMHLDTGRVIGVEALARWQHPTRGMVSPAEFIPAAERTGLIVPLGRWVLRETCRQAAAWLAEFGPDALSKVGPNVSARQLHDPDFVADVAAALADSGLPADRLLLELTESAVLRGRQVSRTLHQLHDMGIGLALDDFGTGESSLSLLRSFPAAVVKLDKSFVDGIEIDDGDPAACDARQAVARAVIQLADALRLDAVAEGVENAEQAAKLRELGYPLGQGYHLARPMPAADLTRLLAAQRDTAAPVAPESVAAAN